MRNSAALTDGPVTTVVAKEGRGNRIEENSVEVVEAFGLCWKTSMPLSIGDYTWSICSHGQLCGLEAEAGERAWEAEGPSSGSRWDGLATGAVAVTVVGGLLTGQTRKPDDTTVRPGFTSRGGSTVPLRSFHGAGRRSSRWLTLSSPRTDSGAGPPHGVFH